MEIETAIFRIVQECLANIHRHSESKTAAVRLKPQPNEVVVIAEDQGIGISTEKLRMNSDGRGGVGFRGMRERVRHLGGTLEIESGSGKTTVTARLPLSQAALAQASG